MLKILIVSPTFEGIGGIARHVRGLSKFLINDGHKVEVLSSDNTFTIPLKKLKNPSFMVSAYFKGFLKRDFDIVHAQGPPAAFAMRNVKGKKVLSLHGIHHKQVTLLHGETAGMLAEKYEKFALEWADAVTVTSKEMLDYYGSKVKDINYIPNAISISEFSPNKHRKYDKQIVYAARLSREKGILTVLEMAEKLPDEIHLLLVGGGPEEDNVKKLANKKQNIHFLGPQDNKKTIEIIRGSDLLIQPSLMEGGTSYTLLEAMACKTPVLCTDVGGGKDLLKHMQNAFIIAPERPQELLDGILDLMNDEKKRQAISQSAYTSVLNFDWQVIGSKYIELYNKLLNR